MNRTQIVASLSAALLLLAAPSAASAHGNVRCNSGPKSGWKSIEDLKAKVIKDGWTVKKAHPARDCYELYGTMADGKKVEAFFHPVTFEAVEILQRGKSILPAK